MKLLLLIVKLSVYSVLTYLFMVVITVLAPKSEQNLLEGNTKEEKTERDHKDVEKLRTILKASDKKNFPMAIPNNVDLSCLKENGSLIVVVKSKIDNFDRRQDIRLVPQKNIRLVTKKISGGDHSNH